MDKAGVLHAPFGRVSFDEEALSENLSALLAAVVRAKPAASKGRYLQSVSISSTMGPGVRIDESSVVAEGEA